MFKPTVVSIPEACEIVSRRCLEQEKGDANPLLYLPGNAGRISPVEDWIFENATKLAGVDVFQMLALGPAEGWAKAVMGGVHIVTPFIGPGVRALVNKGLARNIRCNLSQLSKLFHGMWKPDVAFAHVSPPDMIGRVTLGPNAGIDITAVRCATLKIAIVNKQMPRWHIATYFDPPSGRHIHVGCAMFLSEFDYVVEIDEPIQEHVLAPDKDSEDEVNAVAEHILRFLSPSTDAADLPHVIQLGIGKIPNAFANVLAERGQSVQGVWSELISDGVLRLYENELVRNSGKFGFGLWLRNRIVLGLTLGSRELYEVMRDNPHFAVVPQEIVNDPWMIKHNQNMVSINSTISVSLSGEVAAATIRNRYHSDVGGQFDFALGASWSEGGVAIIALSSTAELHNGVIESKIVATHSEGAHHTIGADLPVVVITEHGAADLRELSDTDRVEAMIGVAHPDWRPMLSKEARELPSMQGVGVIPTRLVALRSGRTATMRPATKRDIPLIRKYIACFSSSDRRTRYMGAINIETLTSEARLMKLYHATLDYLDHAAFVLELDGEVIGIAHAFKVGNDGEYEISFSRRSDLYGQGIGGQLMRVLIDWGVASGATRFDAVTYRNENPRMRALFDRFGFTPSEYEGDPSAIAYTAAVQDLADVNARASID